MSAKTRFIITIESGVDPLGWRDPAYRLKLFLKLAARAFGFRCTSIIENSQPETPAKK